MHRFFKIYNTNKDKYKDHIPLVLINILNIKALCATKYLSSISRYITNFYLYEYFTSVFRELKSFISRHSIHIDDYLQ